MIERKITELASWRHYAQEGSVGEVNRTNLLEQAVCLVENDELDATQPLTETVVLDVIKQSSGGRNQHVGSSVSEALEILIQRGASDRGLDAARSTEIRCQLEWTSRNISTIRTRVDAYPSWTGR
jgi:hypothetical protein